MRITCSCGIDYQVYDYPPAEIEEGGKKMMERHIMCPCDREVVVRTAPKYEPTASNTEEAENTSGVVSFDELVRRLKQGQQEDPPPAPAANPGWGGNWAPPPPKAQKQAPVAVPAPSPVIVDPNATPAPTNDEKGIFLTQDEADTVGALIANYGLKFKDAEAQKEEVQEFAELAERAKLGGMFSMSEKEQRMCRMAFLERNVKKLWPIAQYADEDEFEVVQTAKAKDLRERFKNLCGWDDRR